MSADLTPDDAGSRRLEPQESGDAEAAKEDFNEQVINRATRTFFETGDWSKVGQVLLREAIARTGSVYGFVGVLLKDKEVLRILAYEGVEWSPEINHDFYEQAVAGFQERGFLEFTEFNSLYGAVLKSRASMIFNDPAHDPRAHGTPSGHPPLRAFLGSPMQAGDELVGMVGVANRPGGYAEKEQKTLETIANMAMVLYDSYRRQAAKEAADIELKLAAKVFEAASEGIVVTDKDNRIVMVNDAYCRIMGYSREDVIGKNPRAFASGRHGEDFYRAMWGALIARDHWEGEIWDRAKDGRIFPKYLTIDAVRDGQGSVINYVGVFLDISEQKAREKQIEHLAYHDSLTALPNRYLLYELLEQAVAAAKRSGRQVGVFFIDVDYFKRINDSLGHTAGDLLLLEIGERLRRCLREVDIVARLGGDEFVVVLPEAPETAEMAHLAEKIRAALHKPYALPDGQSVQVTVSVGVGVYPRDATDANGLLSAADMAMYGAKERGRDGCRFFAADPADPSDPASRAP